MTDAQYEALNAAAAKWAEVVWTVSWQFCVLGFIALLLHLSLYRAAPNWRYWLCQILAIKLLLMPFWTATAPWKWPSSGRAHSSSTAPPTLPETLLKANQPGNERPVPQATNPIQLNTPGKSLRGASGSQGTQQLVTSTVSKSMNRIPPEARARQPDHFTTTKPPASLQNGAPAISEFSQPDDKLTRQAQHSAPLPAVTHKTVARQQDAATAPERQQPAVAKKSELSWQTWLMFAWAGGVIWLGGRIIWQGLALGRRLRTTTHAEPAVIQRVHAAAQQLGLSRIPEVGVIDLDVSPFVCGLWRQRLILPRGLAESFTSEQLDMVLLHELAHIRRRDLAWGWIPEVAKVFFFFHPLVHVLCHQIRFERELACDQVALLSSGRDVATYAETLVRVVGQFSCPDSFRVAAVENPPN